MTFTCEVEMNSAAFEDYLEEELGEVLKKVIRRVGSGHQYGKCIDSNGNTVGKWEIDPE